MGSQIVLLVSIVSGLMTTPPVGFFTLAPTSAAVPQVSEAEPVDIQPISEGGQPVFHPESTLPLSMKLCCLQIGVQDK